MNSKFAAPEKKEIRVGFIALTDCASVVMAAERKFDEQYGIKIIPCKEASWASIRDKLLSGELDAAHALYGLVYGVHMGVGGPKQDMNVLMTLSHNGQGISLAAQMRELGAVDGASLKQVVSASAPGTYTFAQTFPTGTHAMWLYYWLAANNINPLVDVRTIVVPPPQMTTYCSAGAMHGFCVGEPWNQQGISDHVSFSVAASQDVWVDHPEKVLGTTAAWTAQHPNAARALTAAVLEASRWLDASLDNRRSAVEVLAQPEYIDTDREVILARMLGQYENGLGKQWQEPNHTKFFNDGAVNYPYLSDGMWFLTQHKRWGLLKSDPDYLGVAQAINRTDIYAEVAGALAIPIPPGNMRSSTLMDGVVWDGSNPAAYAAGFAIKA